MSTKRTQPDWAPPNNENQAKLHLFNSLTRSKELFVPQNGNKVNNPKILLFSGFDFLFK
jgi:cysteinyl-tRNA synthetase